MLTDQSITQDVIDLNKNCISVYNNSGTWDVFTESDDLSGKTLGIAVLDNDSFSTQKATVYTITDNLSDVTFPYETTITFDTSETGVYSEDIKAYSSETVLEDTKTASGTSQEKKITSTIEIDLGSVEKSTPTTFSQAITLTNDTEPSSVSLTIENVDFPIGIKGRWNDIGGSYVSTLPGRGITGTDLYIDIEIDDDTQGYKRKTLTIEYS